MFLIGELSGQHNPPHEGVNPFGRTELVPVSLKEEPDGEDERGEDKTPSGIQPQALEKKPAKEEIPMGEIPPGPEELRTSIARFNESTTNWLLSQEVHPVEWRKGSTDSSGTGKRAGSFGPIPNLYTRIRELVEAVSEAKYAEVERLVPFATEQLTALKNDVGWREERTKNRKKIQEWYERVAPFALKSARDLEIPDVLITELNGNLERMENEIAEDPHIYGSLPTQKLVRDAADDLLKALADFLSTHKKRATSAAA